MLDHKANNPRGVSVKRPGGFEEKKWLTQPIDYRKKVQLHTPAEAPGTSDVPQRHEIAMQTDRQML